MQHMVRVVNDEAGKTGLVTASGELGMSTKGVWIMHWVVEGDCH